jgi:rhodanese-related sulfurtransferase
MTALKTLTPAEARRLVESGARLVDIRNPDEFARARVPGAENRPVDELTRVHGDAPVIFLCRSGMRTAANAGKLAACCGEGYLLEGGLEGWREAGLPVEEDRTAPLEIMRQVQIAAGSLVLIGVILGFLVSPVLFGLSAFVGAGLVMAGTTGWCGMAHLLALMPWNRRAA